MTKKGLAKIIAWLGGSITALSVSGQFGKYAGIAGTIGAGLTTFAVHLASDTSAGHPNGSN